MKTWPADHPKAKLMKRKRDAIVAAARRQFLANGYEGTSMEAVAADAGVSIMTLYRHARSKDELFEAVVSIACDDGGEESAPNLSRMSLAEILTATGLAFQEKLTGEETMAILRAVIAEHERFPELAGIAYGAAIGHLSEFVDKVLADSAGLPAGARRKLAEGFIDDLFGADTLRVLLGLKGKSKAEQRKRAADATRKLLEAVAAVGVQSAAGFLALRG